MDKHFLNMRGFRAKQRNAYENQAHSITIFVLRRKFFIFADIFMLVLLIGFGPFRMRVS